MISPTVNVLEHAALAVRCSDGELFEFPVVDNKGVFPNFFRTKEAFKVRVCISFMEEEIYTLYKRHKNIAYLVCVWDKKEDINEEAMSIIKGDESLHYLLNVGEKNEQ